jgi:hypothetical protein
MSTYPNHLRIISVVQNLNSAAGKQRQRDCDVHRFSPLRLWRLSKAHAWSATVIVDELDAARWLHRNSQIEIVSCSNRE